ncbi:MAG: RNA polymerase sigma factor [Ilumatobacteraceae bacterium]
MKHTTPTSQRQDRFLAFYDATFTEAYRYAGRLCGSDRDAAEDLVQEAYTAVLRQFRADADRDLQIGYVITTIRHRFLDRLRRAESEARRLRLVAVTDGASESESESEAGSDLPDTTLTSHLAGLPERDRAALVLRYVDDLPVPDVAEALGLSVHATESLLVRARARLRGKDIRHA